MVCRALPSTRRSQEENLNSLKLHPSPPSRDLSDLSRDNSSHLSHNLKFQAATSTPSSTPPTPLTLTSRPTLTLLSSDPDQLRDSKQSRDNSSNRPLSRDNSSNRLLSRDNSSSKLLSNTRPFPAPPLSPPAPTALE